MVPLVTLSARTEVGPGALAPDRMGECCRYRVRRGTAIGSAPGRGGVVSTFWLGMLGGEVRYYDAGGVRTRCLEAGSGPALVLLHGTGGHAESWIRNVMPLAAHFRVYAL